jgi:colanic acid/amylovoran biosynthesis protein
VTVELRGVNTHNKGAHLMMIAVAHALRPDFTLTVSPNGSDYERRAELGYRQTLILNQASRASSVIGDIAPRKVREMFGLTARKEITGVLDAAGFAYSDSFSADRARREFGVVSELKKRGAKVVFLPQAFGPFTKPAQREWSGKLLRLADIVYVRDRTSLTHIESLDPTIAARLAPDFTVGLDTSGVRSRLDGAYGAIVPNQKMVSHAGLTESEYVEELTRAGRMFRAHGLKPVVVIHEFNDRRIGARIADALDCEVVEDADPLVLKKVLGAATAAVASRFHAIVSALAGGTPVVAHGWSHKYAELLRDFGVPEWHLKTDSGLEPLVERIIAAEKDGSLARVRERGEEIRSANRRMWDEVRDVLTPRS